MSEAAKAQPPITADELWAMPDDGVRRELIAGEVLEMAPASPEHGRLSSRLMGLLTAWVLEHEVGETYIAEPGFILSRDPDTVRAPDGAYCSRERAPIGETRFTDIIPELVLETVSPTDSVSAVHEKIAVWLGAGVQVVWVLWPERRQLQAYSPSGDVAVYHATDTLTCEDLLPGFALPLARVFG